MQIGNVSWERKSHVSPHTKWEPNHTQKTETSPVRNSESEKMQDKTEEVGCLINILSYLRSLSL